MLNIITIPFRIIRAIIKWTLIICGGWLLIALFGSEKNKFVRFIVQAGALVILGVGCVVYIAIDEAETANAKPAHVLEEVHALNFKSKNIMARERDLALECYAKSKKESCLTRTKVTTTAKVWGEGLHDSYGNIRLPTNSSVVKKVVMGKTYEYKSGSLDLVSYAECTKAKPCKEEVTITYTVNAATKTVGVKATSKLLN